MANKTQLNDYEKLKRLRVQENQARLQDLGVKNIAKSLTSLVESKKTKKKKLNPTFSNARDVEYIPEMGDDSGEDYTEVATSVELARKQYRPRYISTMSMNKIANLTKQRRVIAPMISDSNTVRENHSKATLTMGDLISSNKETRQREVFKQNLVKPTFIKHRSKKSLVLVDEDDNEDDDGDDEIFQDMEPTGLEYDGNKGYIVRSQGYVDQDDENEDMDFIASASNDDEIERDDSHDDLEDEDDTLVQDQLQQPELEKAKESKTKKRGPTMLHLVHTRKVDKREVIICNEFGQRVGPVTKEKDVVRQFSRFLGTLARNHSYAPLIHTSWKKVPHKDKIWEYVLEKYDVPNAAKSWVLKSIGQSYKVHKCRFKKKYFYQYKDNKTRWKNQPRNIPEDHFSQLLRLWNNKDVEEQMKNYKPSEDGSILVDPFTIVMNKERDGYLRLYGKGVTKTMMKKMNGGEEPYMISGGFMESFTASLDVEKTQLLEMRKDIEEDHQRKKAEIEAMRKDFDNQQANFEATMRNIMEKLPAGVLEDLRDD